MLGGDQRHGVWRRISSANAADLAALRALLRRLSGQTHLLVSAAALARDGAVALAHASPCADDHARLQRRISWTIIWPRKARRCLSSVGCYHFEGRGAQLFDSVEGDYFSVLGLPLLPVLAQLRKEGVLAS